LAMGRSVRAVAPRGPVKVTATPSARSTGPSGSFGLPLTQSVVIRLESGSA